MDVAKVFWPGRSQAVRLPRDYWVDGDAVRILRRRCEIIFEPIVADWAWLDGIAAPFDDAFIAATEEDAPPLERQAPA